MKPTLTKKSFFRKIKVSEIDQIHPKMKKIHGVRFVESKSTKKGIVTNENIKWQIHAESCVSQVMLWIIVAKLFTAWYVDVLAFIMITGNFLTAIKSANKLPKNYFK